MLSDYSIDIHALRRKEIFVVNVRRQNNCIQDTGSDGAAELTHR